MRIYIRRETRAQSSVSDCRTNGAQCCGDINRAPAAPPQRWESPPQEEILQASYERHLRVDLEDSDKVQGTAFSLLGTEA